VRFTIRRAPTLAWCGRLENWPLFGALNGTGATASPAYKQRRDPRADQCRVRPVLGSCFFGAAGGAQDFAEVLMMAATWQRISSLSCLPVRGLIRCGRSGVSRRRTGAARPGRMARRASDRHRTRRTSPGYNVRRLLPVSLAFLSAAALIFLVILLTIDLH
jgi:hypothetical protein